MYIFKSYRKFLISPSVNPISENKLPIAPNDKVDFHGLKNGRFGPKTK